MRQPHCRTRSDDANSNEHQRKLVSSLGDIRGSCGRGHGWDRCRSVHCVHMADAGWPPHDGLPLPHRIHFERHDDDVRIRNRAPA